MAKIDRREIAKQTVEISKRGFYTSINGNIVKFDTKINSEFWKSDDIKKLSPTQNFVNTIYTCVNENVVDTVLSLKDNIGVLNFASAKNPGGGFLNGSMAQEEAIAYSSNLYLHQIDTPYYALNREYKSKMYLDNMIFSKVTFFRDGKFNLIDNPRIVSVLTAPAVNMGQVKQKGENIETAKNVMYKRMELILNLFAEKGCETIVLGAFGCGVFKNEPEEIAKNWVALLKKNHYFKNVVMCVLDNKGKTYSIFKKYFG